MAHPIFIIAEAGVNHNGSLELAYQLVDAAIDAGVDAIKFQTFKTENLVTKGAEQAAYQMQNTGEEQSQFAMLKALELDFEAFRLLKRYCDEKGIRFLSTPFDSDSLTFLVEQLKLDTIKIPSGEITNAPFLVEIARYGVRTILSTGMASMEEINRALAFLSYGYSASGREPVDLKRAESFYQSQEAKRLLRENVRVLHCTTEYPAPLLEVNLRAIDYLRDQLDLPIGFSDHTLGIAIPIAAAARGTAVIEKHFTLDKTLPGPDHKASLEPNELKEMVAAIRAVEQSLGSYGKEPTASEVKNKMVVQKSLVASVAIKEGEKFTAANVTVKRPGTGISPFYYWDLIGQFAKRDYEPDEVIRH